MTAETMRQRLVVWVACLLVVGLSGCASMPTKEKRAREAALLGLVSHPEMEEFRVTFSRLEQKIDDLMEKVANLQGVDRDNTEHTDDLVRKLLADVEALRAELKGRR